MYVFQRVSQRYNLHWRVGVYSGWREVRCELSAWVLLSVPIAVAISYPHAYPNSDSYSYPHAYPNTNTYSYSNSDSDAVSSVY
jgi:hypothetical protein